MPVWNPESRAYKPESIVWNPESTDFDEIQDPFQWNPWFRNPESSTRNPGSGIRNPTRFDLESQGHLDSITLGVTQHHSFIASALSQFIYCAHSLLRGLKIQEEGAGRGCRGNFWGGNPVGFCDLPPFSERGMWRYLDLQYPKAVNSLGAFDWPYSGIRIRGVMIKTVCLARFEAARIIKICLKYPFSRCLTILVWMSVKMKDS